MINLVKRLRIFVGKRLHLPIRFAGTVPLYGQGLEDMYLLRIFQSKSTGYFVDVGANDGIFLSNTYALFRKGWRGLCIEPNPEAYGELVRHRQGDVCIQAGIGRTEQMGQLLWRKDLTEGSSFNMDLPAREQGCVVRVRTLTAVLDENKAPAEFDFLSIDVEGMELEVLGSLDWGRYKPRVVVLEYNSEGKIRREAFEFLIKLGYLPVVINRWNVIMSCVWEQDSEKAHSGQGWYMLGKIRV